jgi:hypothetical protein
MGDFAGMMGGPGDMEGDEDEEEEGEKPKKKVKVPKSDSKQAVGEEAKQECKQQ